MISNIIYLEAVMKQLIIVGAGEFGRELYWTIQGSIGYGTDYRIKGFIDDDDSLEKVSKLSAPFLGKIDEYTVEKEDVFTCAIASPSSREIVINRMLDRKSEFIDIIHSSSIIHGTVKLGKGVIVSPYTCIGDASVIGNYTVINGLSCIGHDCVIGEFTCIMSHCDITGHSEIGRKVFIGGGARTVPGTKIEDEAYVGAGSVVLRKVKIGKKVFGNPAKEI